MIDFIIKLRKRPEEDRKVFALITSGVITGIVALFWIIGEFHALSNRPGIDILDASTTNPFDDIKNQIQAVQNVVNTSFSDPALNSSNISSVDGSAGTLPATVQEDPNAEKAQSEQQLNNSPTVPAANAASSSL